MSEWQISKVGILFKVKGGKRLPKGNLLQSLPNQHPYIRITDMKNCKLLNIDNLFMFVPDDIHSLIKNYTVNKGDLILSIVGQIGRLNIIGHSLDYASLTENCVKLIPYANSKIDVNFAYYYLISEYGAEQIDSRIVGSTQPKLPIYNINTIEIPVPPLAEQKAIASVLSSLDDKIDLLHRQNKTLESMAETLFRQWFVEEAQDNWEEVTLSDVCHRITDGAHASPKSIENGWAMASVKDMETWGINYDTCRRISKEDYDELVRADCKALKGDILIAKDGSYLKHVFLLEKDIDVVLLSSIAMLRPNGRYDPMLLTIFLKMNSTREEMENIVTGAVIPRIVLKDFRKFPIRLPPREYQTKALIQISPIFRKCWLNNSQIKKLEKLRDTLLPKLMSGEVRVNYTPEEIKQ